MSGAFPRCGNGPLRPREALAHNGPPSKSGVPPCFVFSWLCAAQERELSDAIAHMKPKAALAAEVDQAKRREVIAKARQEAADKLVELQGRRAGLEAEAARVVASAGPARFLAAQLGTDRRPSSGGWSPRW